MMIKFFVVQCVRTFYCEMQVFIKLHCHFVWQCLGSAKMQKNKMVIFPKKILKFAHCASSIKKQFCTQLTTPCPRVFFLETNCKNTVMLTYTKDNRIQYYILYFHIWFEKENSSELIGFTSGERPMLIFDNINVKCVTFNQRS